MLTLPEHFIKNSLTALPPEERLALLAVLCEGEAARGLRLRPGALLAVVRDALPGAYEPIPWAKDAFYIESESRAGGHPLHAAGAFYLQEPSAMAAVPLLSVKPGQRVLDLCAAPGGKSTQIAALLAGEGVLVSNEYVSTRAKVLSQNIERMGVTNAVVTNEPPDKLARAFGSWFDRVLVDAPCSGEGMFRRDPEAVSQWSPDAPSGCATRQRQILDSAACLLRKGGVLVYSTCTFNEIENEAVVESFISDHPAFSLIKMERLWPHRVSGEGHFVAAMRKGGEEVDGPRSIQPADAFPDIPLGGLLADLEGVSVQGRLCQNGERLWAQPMEMPPLSGIRVLRTGLCLGEKRGRLFIPDHALALAVSPITFPRVFCVDDEQAALFLRGETLPAEDQKKGWTLVSYRGFGLGFGKCSEGVLKNHLPKGLRKN